MNKPYLKQYRAFGLLLYMTLLWPVLYAQQVQVITTKTGEMTLNNLLTEIRKQTGYDFVLTSDKIDSNKKINSKFENASLNQVLDRIFPESGDLYYVLEKRTIVIIDRDKARKRTVSGTIALHSNKQPVAGASIRAKGEKINIRSDAKGRFTLQLPEYIKYIEVNFMGCESAHVQLSSEFDYLILLQEKAEDIGEVVITGIFNRKKDSFTGSSATYSGKELKEVGVQNIIQSLKTLDPAFNLIENNQYGSDPNRLPDLEIRGKTSIVGLKEQFGEDPNQPLFILDGFETTLRTIMDLSMDRVATVTLLKDAASTAIYGAKAANGVVVIETKAPEKGKMRISYNGSADLSFPDLTDYNLMNATEKLEFEVKAGRYKSNLSTVEESRQYRYYHFDQEVKRGVDTYWLAEPLRTGINQRNNLYLEGGDQDMRYGVGVNNGGIQGVMKNSLRNTFNGNIDFNYRKNTISFMNKFSVDHSNSRNPVVDYSSYSRANPYYRKYNAYGAVDKWLEREEDFGMSNVGTPLWDDALNSKDMAKSLGFRNNFNLEYRPLSVLVLRGRVGLSKTISETEVFYSPDATRFDGVDLLRKGSYTTSTGESTSYQGDVSATYGQSFHRLHLLNIVAGASLNQSSSITKGFQAEGFPEGDFTTPAFANAYPEGGKPSYYDSKRRNAGFFINTGYSFANRYLLDLNLRSDGTSVFGANRLFSTTWSAGLAWNLHEEKFIKDRLHGITMFKLRGSVGNPGNQNFGTFNALTTYKFNNWLQNNFGTGLYIDKFGDPDLEWQKTLDKNIGLDMSVLHNRMHLTFDYYHKKTDPLLASVGIPLSVGTANRLMNVGMQVDKGFSGTLRYAFLYRPQERINWTTSLTFRHGTAYYDKIGNRLDAYNRENVSKNLSRYYNGASPTALWSVISMGIDPATGRELFQNKNNDMVYTYSYNDEVVVGDTRPILDGVLGNTFYWKGFSGSFHIRYSYGGDIFNNTLYSKVENISSSEIDKNQDRRALHDRWQKVGDVAQFKGISLNEYTPISSRFVQENNFLSLESVRVGYELSAAWLQRLSLSYVQFNAYMNDIARIATIKNERGIDYPFARAVSFGVNVNF